LSPLQLRFFEIYGGVWWIAGAAILKGFSHPPICFSHYWCFT